MSSSLYDDFWRQVFYNSYSCSTINNLTLFLDYLEETVFVFGFQQFDCDMTKYRLFSIYPACIVLSFLDLWHVVCQKFWKTIIFHFFISICSFGASWLPCDHNIDEFNGICELDVQSKILFKCCNISLGVTWLNCFDFKVKWLGTWCQEVLFF